MGLFALRRYIPYMRPYLGLVIVFGLAQLGSLAAAASIPKVIQLIIDGPIAHHQLSQLLPMAGLLVLIGLLEFVLVYVRRTFSGTASTFTPTSRTSRSRFTTTGSRVSCFRVRSLISPPCAGL